MDKIAGGALMKKSIAVLLPLVVLAGCGTLSGEGQSAYEQLDSRARASAKVHTELAGMYYERAKMGIALGEIDIALQADSNYAPAYYMRGLIHMDLHEDKEAERDFQQSLRLDKTDPKAHYNYGWFLCQRGKEKESIPYFMAALKNPLYETPELAYLNAGLCSRKAGNSKDAEEFLQRALQVRPGLPQALLGMAEVSFGNGDYAAAKKYFAKFSEKSDSLTAEQLWLAVRIERKAGNRGAETNFGIQLRKRFPDARETQLFMHGE